MSPEAAVVVEPGTDHVPLEVIPPEAGQESTPETPPENTPKETPAEGSEESNLPPESGGQPSESEAQIQLYREVLSKAKEDSNYQMTDAEAEAFLDVQDKIADGMEDPGPAEPPGEKPAQVPKEGEQKEGAPPAEDGEDKDLTATMDGLTDENSKVLIEAMKRVGAKDISELDGKIEGLINHMKSSGGKQGSELAAMKKREEAHMSWIEDLKKGTPAALEFLDKVTNRKFTTKPPKEGSSSGGSGADEPLEELENLDDYLDDKLAREVQALKKVVKTQSETIDKLSQGDQQRADANERKSAADGWIDDVVDLVVDPKNKGAFALTASEARALAQQYWGPQGHTQPVHPKFQQIHELIKFAHDRSMPDLQSAYIVWHHENGNYAKKLIQATKQGQAAVQHEPSQNAFISQKQAKTKTNVPNPNVSQEDVSKMERGDFDSIPDEWMDAEGNLLPDKVPERFHAAAFGKLGKPK